MVSKGYIGSYRSSYVLFSMCELAKDSVSPPKKQILYKIIENFKFKSNTTNEALPSSGSRRIILDTIVNCLWK